MDTTLINKVNNALDSIRPYLEADGGDVKLLEITEDNVVKLELLGACSDCKMSEMTLKSGVEEAIKRVAPEIISIVSITNAIPTS